MTDKIQKALDLAKSVHEGQIRKFTGKSYFDEHILKVYELVSKYGSDEDEKIASILHDSIEDQPKRITYDVIKREFGVVVADMVEELTSNEDLLNQMGKGPYLLHKMLKMSVGALKIKLCDRLCNISDLMTASEKFRVKYYKETRFIMDGLVERNLDQTHRRIVSDIEAVLDEVNSYYHYDSFKPKMKYLKFGKVASGYVKELTSDDEMIEKMGKAEYMKDKLSHISEGGLKVKLADRYCNISDMMTAPEKFRNKYYPETRTMLEGVEGRSLPEAQQKIVDDINEILDAVKKKYYENKAYRNKYIKMYEAFKKKNITVDDLVQCVNHGGVIYTQIIKNLPDNNPEQPLHTVSVDDDGLVTVEIDGKNYEVEMKNIDKIEYDKK